MSVAARKIEEETFDDRLCRLCQVIGIFHVEEEREEKTRLRTKYKLLTRRHPGKFVDRPDLHLLQEPEQWKAS